MNMLWSPNPRTRRRRKMSAKQMKYFGGGKRKRRSGKRRSHRASFRQAGFVAPFAGTRKHRRRARAVARHIRRRARRAFAGFSRSGAIGLLKAGAIGGAGAVLVDIAMGQAVGFLPASMQAPTDNKTGGVNYGYWGAKLAIVLGLGMYGRRLPFVGHYAGAMAEGAATVMAYQFMRPMVPATLNLAAYFNPAATRAPRVGAYQTPAIAVRAGSPGGRGGRAASVLALVRHRTA